jgi:hypothetical protein
MLRIIIQGDGMASGKTELQRNIITALKAAGYSPIPIGFNGTIPEDTSIFDTKKLIESGRRGDPDSSFWRPDIGKDNNDGCEVAIFEMNVPE